MIRTAVYLLLAILAYAPFASAEPLRHVRVASADAASIALQLEREGFDVLRDSITESSVDLVVSAEEQRELEQRAYAVSVVAVGRPFYDIQAEGPEYAVPSGYMDLDAILDSMDATASSYPAIASVVDLTEAHGTPATFEGRHLYAIKISDNVTAREDEPAFLIVGAHHCRELVTPVIALDAIERLTSGYGVDPRVTDLVDGHEIWIAPVWNPDGYVEVFSGDNLWRKNRRVFAGGTGVDLNRNYPTGWSTACSGSTSVTSNTYKGPAPASEAETATMMAWSEDVRFAKVLDFHSSGREVLWGYACVGHPWDAYLQDEATALSSHSGYWGDERPPTADGEHYQWQLARGASEAFLTETHTSFQPSFASAQAEAATVWPGTIWFLEQQIPLSGHVTDATTGIPLVATVSYPGVSFGNDELNTSFGPFGRYHAFLPAGSHVVEFSAPGYLSEERTVVLGPSDSIAMDVELHNESAAIPAIGGAGLVTLVAALLGSLLLLSRGRTVPS